MPQAEIRDAVREEGVSRPVISWVNPHPILFTPAFVHAPTGSTDPTPLKSPLML